MKELFDCHDCICIYIIEWPVHYSEESYVAVDHCPRSLLEVCGSEGGAAAGKHALLLTLLENHEGRTVEMVGTSLYYISHIYSLISFCLLRRVGLVGMPSLHSFYNQPNELCHSLLL